MSDSAPHNRLKVFAWKGYAGVVLLLVLIDMVVAMSKGDGHWMLLALKGFWTLSLCVPLVGWAWQRLFAPRSLGKLSFYLCVVLGVLVVLSAPMTLLPDSALTLTQVSIAVLACVLLSPFAYACFMYGWRSPHLSES
jgi:cell division protein FtsW (lipid II flippase)